MRTPEQTITALDEIEQRAKAERHTWEQVLTDPKPANFGIQVTTCRGKERLFTIQLTDLDLAAMSLILNYVPDLCATVRELLDERDQIRAAFGENPDTSHEQIMQRIATTRHEARDYCNVSAKVERLSKIEAVAKEIAAAEAERHGLFNWHLMAKHRFDAVQRLLALVATPTTPTEE